MNPGTDDLTCRPEFGVHISPLKERFVVVERV